MLENFKLYSNASSDRAIRLAENWVAKRSKETASLYLERQINGTADRVFQGCCLLPTQL
jgi:hypothetical protein